MIWLKRKYWLARGWFESKQPDGNRGWYGMPVVVLVGGAQKPGLIVADRCGRFFGHGTVIMLTDGTVQIGGVYRSAAMRIDLDLGYCQKRSVDFSYTSKSAASVSREESKQ